MLETTSILALLSPLSGMAACSDNGTRGDQLIRATWLNPQMVGDVVSIPVGQAEDHKITHIELKVQDENMTSMAYDLSGEIYVRAGICPPRQSIGFSLGQSTPVCDTCEIVFSPKTGSEINGACLAYLKAAVAYELRDGSIVTKGSGLLAVYHDAVDSTQASEATVPSCHNGPDKPTVLGCCGSADRPSAPRCYRGK